MKDAVIDAYLESCAGFSPDRVIADPELNRGFLKNCRKHNLRVPPAELNLRLLNLRKRSALPRSKRRTSISSQGEFSFAAEIAVRCLERRHQTTLDRILCDPQLAAEFDDVAHSISPGFSSLQYRWAALRLRKLTQLKPEILGRVVQVKLVGPMSVSDLNLADVPAEQGLYVVSSRQCVLYVGEAHSLRARLKKHFEHSDNEYLARHIWDCGLNDLLVEYHVLPSTTTGRVRRAMELELIRSRRAEFNVQR